MNNQELKDALTQRYPVICQGVVYAYVSAIIYRSDNGKIVVTAELMDIHGKSVTIAKPNYITRSDAGK